MKILHTSDIHMESPLGARLGGERLRERKLELVRTFERMADEAVYAGCRLFIIAGDLFDSERITKRAKERVINIVLSHKEVTFLYLPGNHEKDAFADVVTESIPNLSVFGKGWTYFDFDNVTVAGRSEISPDMFDSLTLLPERKNIVVLHGALAERTDGENIGIREAEGKNIDYLALGHYHSHSVRQIDHRGVAVYSGTPEPRGFDEAFDCGFVMVECKERVTYSFRSFAKRQLRIIPTDITGAEDNREVSDRIKLALQAAHSSDLVRIVLTGKRLIEFYPDIENLVSRYTGSYYYFEIEDKTGIMITPGAYKYDKSLKGEFIRLVLSKDNLTDEEKDRIIRCGILALLGEESEI